MLKKKSFLGGGKENVKFQFNLSVDHLFDFKNSSLSRQPTPDEDVFYAVCFLNNQMEFLIFVYRFIGREVRNVKVKHHTPKLTEKE